MTHVTVPATSPLITYPVTTAQTVFTIPAYIVFWSEDDLRVAIDGVDLADTGWSVVGVDAGGGYTGGTLTLATAVSNCELALYRSTELGRSTDFVEGAPITRQELNTQIDKLAAQLVDAFWRNSHALRVADYLPPIDPITAPDDVLINWADGPTSLNGTPDGAASPAASGTDNSSAFATAIAAVVGKGGGRVTIPSGGNYRVVSNINLGNGSAGVFSTWPGFGIEGVCPAGGFGANNPVGGGAIILDGAQIKTPGPQVGGALKDLFVITPNSYPAGRWAVDLIETSYAQIDNLHLSLYAGNGLRMTGLGSNGSLFNQTGRLLVRMDSAVAASGSKAVELTGTGSTHDVASSTFDFIGVLPSRADQVAVTLGYSDTNNIDHLDVYPMSTPSSTAVGATTNSAGYSAGVTTVTLASAGTGTLVAGDNFQFANQTTTYRITSGDADVSGGGSITFTPALTNSIPASPTAITVLTSAVALRLDFSVNADFPQSNTIDHADFFNNRVEAIGTPSQNAKNNPTVIHYLNQQGGTPIPTSVTGLVVNRRRLKEGILYVSTTGNDTGAAGMSVAGALRTIQKAYDLAAVYYDLEGDLTIKLSDGTYTAGLLANIAAIGKKVTIQGNSASPGSVILNVTGDAIVADGCKIVVRDVLISGSANGIRSINGGRIEYTNIVWGSSAGAHCYADGGFIEQTGACFINANAAQHISVRNGRYTSASATTLLANVTVTDFIKVTHGGTAITTGATYPLGIYAVTGRRWLAENDGVIDCGTGSATFFPGSTSGFARSGGQFADLRTYQGPIVLASSAVQVASTAVTTEEVLATISIPAGLLGANGRLRFKTDGSLTSSANNKTLRVRLGGLAGTVISAFTYTTTSGWQMEGHVQNRNSASSQWANSWGQRATDTVMAVFPSATAAINTSAAVDLVITSQKATAGETFTLESYSVELIP